MSVLQTEIDWIPVDYAAAAISDVMLRTAYLAAKIDEFIYHIVNPKIVTWNDVLEAMRACGTKFDRVSSSEWVETLSKDDTNPAYRLMSFYEDSFKKDFKMPIWYTNKTREIAPILGQSPILNADLFGKHLKHWQSIGFYNPFT
ncbi:hypothetical protein G6F56_001728 [Rhizopus delemar]|nr:hypothetical protein G6F56_001728 [Rhizopus delemar]